LSDVARHLRNGAEQTEDRGSDHAYSGLVCRPPEPNVVGTVARRACVDDSERERLTGLLEVREEMQLGLLGDPVWTPHGSDQLGDAIHERCGVGDAVSPLVSIPASIGHHQRIAEIRGSRSRGIRQGIIVELAERIG
jgi:hypothetical protein